LLAQIVDSELENIEIGKEVELVFRKLFVEGEAGVIIYGHKCKSFDNYKFRRKK